MPPNHNSNKADKFKLASEIFYDFKNSLEHVLRENPEIVEEAIKKRNTIIKCLKAEIEHRIVVYKEIVTRYEEMSDEMDSLKLSNEMYKQEISISKNEKEKYEASSESSHKLFIAKQEDFVRLKREKEKLEKDFRDIQDELNKLKTNIAIEVTDKKKSLQYRLTVFVENLPSGFIKQILKFLISKYTFKYTVFFIFCLLVTASITGWPALFGIIKAFTGLF